MSLTAAIRREYVYLSAILRTLWLLREVTPNSSRTIVDIVEGFARRTPQAPAVYCQDDVMSYAQLDARANRYANWAIAQGIKPGDSVALMMENRPDFLCCWLGLFKAGAVVALINTNQRLQPLVHSIEIAGARHVVVGSELVACVTEAENFFATKPAVWVQGGGNLDDHLTTASPLSPGKAPRAGVTGRSRAFYIYTSGTTGLPKAANFSHTRMLFMMTGFVGALQPKSSDRVYDPLPLYHATGGVCAVGMALLVGGALVIRRKFSAGDFWSDIHKYDATLFVYIGELCRWLLNAPQGPHERDHHVRAITDNGLRPEIWKSFQDRFGISKIVEFYGATESNVSMLNYDGTVGAVGRIPEYMEWKFPTRIVRFDVEKEMPVRGADGLCIECAPGEVGEAIGGISQQAGRNFEGYTKASDSEKKVLLDVFRKGDAWFRTGDLMRRDSHGYFSFVDRIGDTYRWKGENVATSEVAEALSAVPGIKEANVYGVSVAGMDGRAGMAALVVDGAFDVTALAQRLEGRLTHFARPLFLRLQPQIEVTGTFKQRKVEMVREGFNPSTIPNPLFWLNPASGRYEPLTAERYADIVEDKVKL